MSFNTEQTPTRLLALAGVLALADTRPPAVSRVPSPCSSPVGSPASSGWAPPPSSPPGLLRRRSTLPGYVEPEGWASPMSPLTPLPPSPRAVMPEATAVEEVTPEQAAPVESIFIQEGMPVSPCLYNGFDGVLIRYIGGRPFGGRGLWERLQLPKFFYFGIPFPLFHGESS